MYHNEITMKKTMKANLNTTYQTSDLQEAAFLLQKKCRLVSLERDRGKVSFVFEDNPDLKTLMFQYINGEALVNPKEFYAMWKDLRARVS